PQIAYPPNAGLEALFHAVPGSTPIRRRLPLLTGLVYLLFVAALAIRSYESPSYEFEPTWLFTATAAAGIAAIVSRRGLDVSPTDYWLPALLMAVAFVSYPSTSRDPFHYLFVGEIVRFWHLSPYDQPPSALPVDQYSIIFRDTYWYYLASPWGPLWQAMMAAINWLSRNQLAVGMILLKLLNAFALIPCAFYVRAITGKAWLAFSLLINPLMLLNTLHTPHTDVILSMLILAAFYHGAPAPRGVLLALAALIKPHVLVLAPFFERK